MADAGFALAQAFVRIRPTATGFRAEATSQVKSALSGVEGEVPITAGTDKAKAQIADLRAYLTALTKRAWAAHITAEDKQFQLEILRVINQLRALDKRTANPKVTLEGITRAQTQMVGLDVQLDKIASRVAVAHIEIDDSDAEAKLALLITQIGALAYKVQNIAVGVSDPGTVARLTALKDVIDSLSSRSLQVNLQDSGALAAISTLAQDTAKAHTELAALVAVTEASGRAAQAAGGRWGFLAARVGVFGGIAAIGGLHLLIDGIVEFLAVVIPATVALGAFVAAAAGPVSDLVHQWQTLNTVGLAMNRNLLPLGGTFSRIQAAVQPQVYALFGDALAVAGQKSSVFQRLVTQTGAALDQLASRAALALSSGGFNRFLQNAAPDLQKIGNAIGNVFGAFGNLLKTMPGYAEVLLNILVGLTHAFEILTGNPIVQGLLRLGLYAHGFFVYAGLAASAVTLLGIPLGALANRFSAVGADTLTATSRLDASAGPLARARAGWKDLASALPQVSLFNSWGSAASKVGSDVEQTAAKTNIWQKALGLLTKVPVWGWVALGAAALGGLVYLLVSASNKTNAWVIGLQNAVNNAQSFGQVTQAVNHAVADSTLHLSDATAKLAHTTGDAATSYQVVAGKAGSFNSALQANAQAVQQAGGALTSFQQQQQLVRTRTDQLVQQFGSLSLAQGLWNQAQIKSSDLAKANAQAWNQDVQTLKALEQAQKAVADSAGAAGNNERVLNFIAGDLYTNTQKLNSAWDTFIGIVTKGQTSFDAVAQGLTAVEQAARKHGATMDGLNARSITLNQAFATQVTNLNALIDSWRSAGLTGRQFEIGVQAAVSTLLPLAKNSHEATSQLVALAQEAGYRGPDSFRELALWIGHTKDAMQTMKRITDQTTATTAALSSALSGQGNLLSQKIIGDINNATLAYSGVYDAATKYGQAVAQDGKNSEQARSARQQLIQDLINSGTAADQSRRQIAAMITKVLGIPTRRALEIVMEGQGRFAVSGYWNLPGGGKARLASAPQGNGNVAVHGYGQAKGWRVPGYGGGDTHPAMLEGGETVVPKHLTPLVAPLMARHGVPGFAGGVINVGNTNVLSGVYAQQSYVAFENAFINAAVKGMQQTALLGSAVGGGLAGRVGSYAGIVSAVLRMLGQPAADLSVVLRQMETESGGNPTVVNKWDSNWAAGTPSVGLMQVIGPTFAAYAGPFRGLGPFEYGVSVNPEANIYAGLNYAIHRYGAGWPLVLGQGHGYDTGGWLPTGLSLAWNGTGRPEPVGPAIPQTLRLQVASGGQSAFEQFMVMAISKWVHVRGGGDVQQAFGS